LSITAVDILPLFPLNVVLFPDSAIRLHIFEERYRILIGQCLASPGKEFGINLLAGKEFSRIGCSAVVTSLIRRYDDGRLDVLVEGKRRYALQRVEENAAPYLMGQVSYLKEERAEINSVLAKDVVVLYNKLIDVAYNGTLPRLAPDHTANGIAFHVARKAGMELQQRQKLLELNSENQRLALLHEYLSGVVPKLHQAQEVQRVISCDGYVLPQNPSEDE
jgi:Lon protease-like protein